MFSAKVAAFKQNRGSLPSGTAPLTASSAFKTRSPQPQLEGPSKEHRLSLEASSRSQSTLKASTATTDPSTISLGTARPSPEYCPWQSIMMRASEFHSSKPEAPNKPCTGWISCNRAENAYDLAIAMNYGYAAGSPQLLRFVTEHIELVHNPPYHDWEAALTCGSSSALDVLFRMLGERGDYILTEAYTYPGAIEAAKPLGINTVGVDMDGEGLRADALDSTLKYWNDNKGRKPSVLYTIPTGQNPTGTTQSSERRRAVYEVAQKHDLTIIEDDPYYFLHVGYQPCPSVSDEDSSIVEDFVQRLPPSYLSLDISGRVVRLDTTSKILAPGLRCGWLTGCSQLIGKFLKHTEFSTVAPSGPSQVMLYKLLDESWSHIGFANWLVNLSLQYGNRLDIVLKACREFLPSEICEWSSPGFGMFVWIKVNFRKHPLAKQDISRDAEVTLQAVEDKIYATTRDRGVQISKGSWFAAGNRSQSAMHFRLTFAAAPKDHLHEAIKLFGSALQDEFFPSEFTKAGGLVASKIGSLYEAVRSNSERPLSSAEML